MDDQMWSNLRGNLKWYRLHNGLSMEAMGRRIGRSREWVNDIECGCQIGRVEALDKIAKSIGSRISDLTEDGPLNQVDFTDVERRQAARYLERKRRALGLTIRQMALRIGMAAQYWYRLQKGQQLLSPCKIYQVAKRLKVPVEEVVKL